MIVDSELALPRSGVLLMAYSLQLKAVFVLLSALTFGLSACSLQPFSVSR